MFYSITISRIIFLLSRKALICDVSPFDVVMSNVYFLTNLVPEILVDANPTIWLQFFLVFSELFNVSVLKIILEEFRCSVNISIVLMYVLIVFLYHSSCEICLYRCTKYNVVLVELLHEYMYSQAIRVESLCYRKFLILSDLFNASLLNLLHQSLLRCIHKKPQWRRSNIYFLSYNDFIENLLQYGVWSLNHTQLLWKASTWAGPTS